MKMPVVATFCAKLRQYIFQMYGKGRMIMNPSVMVLVIATPRKKRRTSTPQE
jgi:hypothetical protein